MYEFIKKKISKNEKYKEKIIPKLISSSLCGGISQFISSPTDLLKIRMISENHKKQNMINLIRNIYNQNGFTYFYKGAYPNVLRASFLNLGSIGTYDIVKSKINQIRKDDSITSVISSIVAGFNATLISTPFDNLKSRIMADKKKYYKNMIDCTYKSIKVNGIRSLFIGFFPNWLRIGPWQFIFWNSYENYRLLFGIDKF